MAAGDDFAALMNKAAELADTDLVEAPEPKKTRSRRRPPSLDELKASRDDGNSIGGEDGGEPAEPSAPDSPPADRPPDEGKAVKRGGRRSTTRPESPSVPYRAGVIAKGMNKLYAKAGKIVRVMDPEIGQAIIDVTRKESDDDVTVGEAWEELAKANPRIRRFLMKVIAGGAWGQLFMAHAPILLAVVMKPAILRLIPFSRVIESLAEPDDDTPEGEGGLPGGMTAADVDQMAQLAQAQAARMGMSIPPEVAAQMAEMAGSMMNGAGPPKPARHQPRRPPSRADRRGH